MKYCNAFWFLSNNFGDALAPFLIRIIGNAEPIWTPQERNVPQLITTGSILNHARANSVVWGAGLAYSKGSINQADIRAVRGKLTGKLLDSLNIRHNNIFGDPALLLGEILPSELEREYISIAPHYIDGSIIENGNFEGLEWIDVNAPIIDVLWKINRSKLVVTSSLHIIIACHAYSIPVVWCKFSDRILGDDFKYYDHFSTMGIDSSDIKFLDLRSCTDYSKEIHYISTLNHKAISPKEEIISNLLNSFPHDQIKTNFSSPS
jgi:hypothetical protein